MPIVSSPTHTKRHKCRPPVEGGRHGVWLAAATPWDKDGEVAMGTIWHCDECDAFFLAHRWAPLLPGWDRVPAWYAHYKIRKNARASSKA